MSLESTADAKSELERALGQTIAEILHAVQKGRLLFSLVGMAAAIVLLTYFVRFARVSFLKEMGTLEFTFALGCACTLLAIGALFEFAVFYLLANRAK